MQPKGDDMRCVLILYSYSQSSCEIDDARADGVVIARLKRKRRKIEGVQLKWLSASSDLYDADGGYGRLGPC